MFYIGGFLMFVLLFIKRCASVGAIFGKNTENLSIKRVGRATKAEFISIMLPEGGYWARHEWLGQTTEEAKESLKESIILILEEGKRCSENC